MSKKGLGLICFDENLCKFWGRSDLELEHNQEKGGYEIKRNGTEGHAIHLSKGDKTALAFIYFVTKLKENDNKIKEKIVIIDDPISSFDNNYIFHAFSFLKSECSNAKQLFLFSHNLTFFKLARDWVKQINQNRKAKGKGPQGALFVVEAYAGSDGIRAFVIKDAPDALRKYNSEYHYLKKYTATKTRTSFHMTMPGGWLMWHVGCWKHF